MVKTAYFDTFSGISGDMVLGALIDLGLDVNYLQSELKKLDISGYDIKVKKVEKNHILGTDVSITVEEEQKLRSFKDVKQIIDNSRLSDDIKKLSKKIFFKLAEAESKIHKLSIEKIHFHEVGAIDSIVDIVGAVIGLKKLQIKNVFCSYIPLGKGFVKCSHGVFPVPAPATVEILRNIPVYSTNIKHEMVTPTGAAIIASIASHFGDMPLMKVNRIGYGVGKTNLAHPNLLRVLSGDLKQDDNIDFTTVIETNIDDMNPEIYGYLVGKLLDNGALDVFFTHIQMKKNRPGVKLSVISYEENVEKLVDIIFSETSTFGVRFYETKRMKLAIEKQKVKTKFGEVCIKIGRHKDKIITVSPEFEDCKRLAIENNIPLKTIYEFAKNKIKLNKEL